MQEKINVQFEKLHRKDQIVGTATSQKIIPVEGDLSNRSLTKYYREIILPRREKGKHKCDCRSSTGDIPLEQIGEVPVREKLTYQGVPPIPRSHLPFRVGYGYISTSHSFVFSSFWDEPINRFPKQCLCCVFEYWPSIAGRRRIEFLKTIDVVECC